MKEKMTMVTDQFGVGKDLVFEPEQESPATPHQPEVPSPEITTELQAAPEPQEPEQKAEPIEIIEPEKKPKTHSANNFKTLKAEAARIAKERDEMKAMLEQYQQQMRQNVPPQPSYQPQSEDFDIEPDAYAEGKHVKSLSKQLKEMKQELERTRLHTQGLAVKAALVSEHPDFERIVTPDNLKALELSYPHLAKAINVNDPYVAGKACYDLIKQFGIDQDDAQDSEITKALIVQNASKPKPAAAVKGTRPTNETAMGRASEFYNGELTDQAKKQFYRELQDAMKGYGGYKP